LDNGTPSGEVVAESLPPNPFDPERIRLGTNYADALDIRPEQLIIPVRNRPPTVPWFRVHPTNEVDILMLDLEAMGSDDTLYYVDASLQGKLVYEKTVRARLLVQCRTQQGADFLWAIKLKGPLDKKENPWTISALKEREIARSRWIRHRVDTENRCFAPLVSDEITDEPEWPDKPFNEILRLALEDRHIASLDHPVLVELLKGKRS
jgi:hypothetical protein